MNLVITCEHGGKDVPPEYIHLFNNAEKILSSHRGWDPGALHMTEVVSKTLNVQPIFSTTTRLLIDLNRSVDNQSLFSEFVPTELHEEILKTYYKPYRTLVEEKIQSSLPVIHLSMHTFTPILNGEIRSADIGILFDPARSTEKTFSDTLLETLAPYYRTKFNYPYLGVEDGFTTYLRTKFSDSEYAGIELEFNQSIANDSEFIQTVQKALLEVFHAV